MNKKIRENFPALKKNVIYFDNAATTLKPTQVIDAEKNYYENFCANIHRGAYPWSFKATEEYEKARETIAKFINAKPNEIIFVRNATEGLNLIATTLKKTKKHNKIVCSVAEHHSNFLPWVENFGMEKVKVLNLNKESKIDLVVEENNQIFSLVHISNVLGIINPIKEFSKQIKEKNNIFVLDATQSVPHIPIDVKKLKVDVLAFSGHKMLGPTGIGVVFIKEELQKDLPNFEVGGGTISFVSKEKIKYANGVERYEAGTPPIAQAIGLKKAIDFLEKIGLENIKEHEQKLIKDMIKGLENLGAKIIGNKKDRIGVVSFNFEGFDPHNLGFSLGEKNIFLRSGHHCAMPLHQYFNTKHSLRASLYLYNTKEEVKIFLEELEKEINKK